MPTLEKWITQPERVFDPESGTSVATGVIYVTGDVGEEHRTLRVTDDSSDLQEGDEVETVSGTFTLGTMLTSPAAVAE